MNKFDELVGRYVNNKKSRNQFVEEANEAFQAIFDKFPKINSFAIIGYTPNFMDGDPCTHSQMVAVEQFDFNDCYMGMDRALREAVGVFAANEEDKEFTFNGEPLPSTWGDDVKQQEQEAFNDADSVATLLHGMSKVFECAFFTNWQFVVKRTDNGFEKIDGEYYDCGY